MEHGHKILVDTDVLIDFLRQRDMARRLLESTVSSHDLYCSVITLAELLAGMRPAEQDHTEALIAGMTLLPVTERIARTAGALRAQAGPRKIQLPDCLIAATALEEECLLLTFNRKDYPFARLQMYED